ncbi:MAG: glycosyl hydrolase [Acidobacteriota bacterium]
MKRNFGWIVCAAFVLGSTVLSGAQSENINPTALFSNLRWRNIGPAYMVGRVSAVEGVPGNPNVVYVGSASGGVWKTINAGTQWTPIFDKQPIASIGDIALEPGNPDVVYVGTGESNVRNSVSFGNGVYKSTDGGKTWRHLGLEDTLHISRIVINPRDVRTLFVGALGHAYGPNAERGVYMSRDGGATWDKVLYLDERHGVADMDINPENPNIVFAALWRFERKPWTFTSGDEEGGLFRSVDGGLTWSKVTRGLPSLVGRMSVKVAPSNPSVVYVMTESKEGTLYRSEDGGVSFSRVSTDVELVSRGFYYTDMRVDPRDENRVYAVSSRLHLSIDGGKTFKRISAETHVDFHSLWIDPLATNRLWQGQDGGVAVSYDRGTTWDYVNNFCVAQFYQIYADNREPFYYVGGGLQDNGTWNAPSRSRDPFGILNDDWRMISFGDGFHIISHPENPDLFLSESQGGNISRTDMRTLEQQNVSPQPRRADGAPVSWLKYRFNWNTPIIASPHDPTTVYVGGNVLFRSPDFGTSWDVISPDLTTNDPDKQQAAGGPAWPENTTAEYHCTIISLAESPVQPGILWAGTDDGNLQVSMNKGESWINVVGDVPGLKAFSSVSHIEASRVSAGKAYCSFDRHMLDDFKPYIYKTTDFGRSWVNITGNLPTGAYVWVIREDPLNPSILYAGTEIGLFVSFTEGKQWRRLHLSNLPVVAVHDILIHPRENDLIIGTHGRGIWILDDIRFLQHFSGTPGGDAPVLFDLRPAVRFSRKATRYGIGDRVFRGENPADGAIVTYYLAEKAKKEDNLRLEILNGSGNVVRTIQNIPGEKGVNRTSWDLYLSGPRPRKEVTEERDLIFRGPQGPQALPETYTVRLILGDRTVEKPIQVKMDPTVDVSPDDLRSQHQYALEMRDMQSVVNDSLRALDLLRDQLSERKKTLAGQADKYMTVIGSIDEHVTRIRSILDILVRPEGTPFWSDGPRLMERLGRLFGSIVGVNAAPIPVQIQYFAELREEFDLAMARVDSYLNHSAKEINKIFQENGVPLILIPEWKR